MSKSVLPDDNRFRYFAPEPMPVIPEGVTMQLEFKTAAELMAERRAWLGSTEPCECCKGRGRIAKAQPPGGE